MCDSYEFFLEEAEDLIDVAILLTEKIETALKSDTCCKEASEQMLAVFTRPLLDINNTLHFIFLGVSLSGTDEEKEVLVSIVRRYNEGVLKTLLDVVCTQLEKMDTSSFDWRSVLGDLTGKETTLNLNDFK